MAIVLIVLIVGLMMMLIEWARPAVSWPRWRGWWLAMLALNGVQIAMIWLAGRCWDPWLRAHRPWSLDALGAAGGAAVGYLAITFVYYWWHRWRHESGFLWRWFHQLHHSAERIEVLTSFYKHPLELAANGVLSSLILYAVVGLGADAAAGAVLLSGLAELVYHWNVSTPRWLGYFFQRPESHRLHHQAGVHAYNYGDLPLWDMLFGTFSNPVEWRGRCGFAAGDERRLKEMLLGRDIAGTRRDHEHANGGRPAVGVGIGANGRGRLGPEAAQGRRRGDGRVARAQGVRRGEGLRDLLERIRRRPAFWPRLAP
jgi:sterol desaturase/sphingolipid hydroxylase (fatty acid hydroxylase superfamily)